MSVARGLLRCWPPAWRSRYGEELLTAIEDGSDGRRLPLRAALDVVRAGLVQRLRSSGLAGDELPPAERTRAGVLLVLCAWAAFTVAGIVLQKDAEHWQDAVPHAARAVPAAAFDAVIVAAAVGSAAVLLGILLALPALLGLLRAGGWPTIRRPILRAVAVSVPTALLLVGLAVWAHRLTSAERNGRDWPSLYSGAFVLIAALIVCSLAAWAAAATATARRLELPTRTLRAETFLALTATLAMLVVTAGTVAWWSSLGGAAPSGPDLPVVAAAMLLATSAATAGTARSLRSR